MATATQVLKLVISGDSRQAQKALSGVSAATKRTSKVMSGLGVAAGGVVSIGLGAWLMEGINKAKAAEASTAVLAKAVDNTGKSFSALKPQIDAALAATSNYAAVGKGDLRAALNQMVTATGNVDLSLKALNVTADLARNKNMSLEAAGRLVGRALNGNVAALSRYGIKLKNGASSEQVLLALEQKLGGTAGAWAQTAEGRIARFNIKLGEIQSKAGMRALPTLERLAERGGDAAEAFGKLDPAAQDASISVLALAGAMTALGIASAPVLMIVTTLAAGYAGASSAISWFAKETEKALTNNGDMKTMLWLIRTGIKGEADAARDAAKATNGAAGATNAHGKAMGRAAGDAKNLTGALAAAKTATDNAGRGAFGAVGQYAKLEDALRRSRMLALAFAKAGNQAAAAAQLYDASGGTRPHATGGIFSSPHVGLVAEAGPEAIIPLGGRYRARSMKLLGETMRRLGVGASGTVVNAPVTIHANVSNDYDVQRMAEVLSDHFSARAYSLGV